MDVCEELRDINTGHDRERENERSKVNKLFLQQAVEA
jgi:hypothetical protein